EVQVRRLRLVEDRSEGAPDQRERERREHAPRRFHRFHCLSSMWSIFLNMATSGRTMIASSAMKVLAIPGSLRVASINAAFCRAASRLAPAPLKISVYSGLGELPLFNADLEADPPRPVREFRDAVGSASALLIASPEYAHGVSGVMKNAL